MFECADDALVDRLDDNGGVYWQVEGMHFATARHQRLLGWVGRAVIKEKNCLSCQILVA